MGGGKGCSVPGGVDHEALQAGLLRALGDAAADVAEEDALAVLVLRGECRVERPHEQLPGHRLLEGRLGLRRVALRSQPPAAVGVHCSEPGGRPRYSLCQSTRHGTGHAVEAER